MKGMRAFLHKLLFTIWLIVFGIAYNDASPLSTFGFSRNMQGQIEYDDASCKSIFGYDGAAMRTASACADRYDPAGMLTVCSKENRSAGTSGFFVRFTEFLAADATAADSQYFISSGVGRSLSSQMNGVNQIPATIVQEGQADIQTTLNLNQLYSPKFEVPADSRLLNIQPPIQVPIEVQPLGIPGQPASIPLNQVKIVPP